MCTVEIDIYPVLVQSLTKKYPSIPFNQYSETEKRLQVDNIEEVNHRRHMHT